MKVGIWLLVIGAVLLIAGIVIRLVTLPDSVYVAGLGALILGGIMAFVGLVRIIAMRID